MIMSIESSNVDRTDVILVDGVRYKRKYSSSPSVTVIYWLKETSISSGMFNGMADAECKPLEKVYSDFRRAIKK
jgi:hypothetical protein